jgi:hypothetical protein
MPKQCTVDGCTGPAKTRGWCNKHYQRWWKHGDPEAVAVRVHVSETCSVEGCDAVARRRGYCDTHYARWRAHGDPTVNKRDVQSLTYSSVHKRVKAYNGPASLYRCAACGAAATDWACYRNRTEQEDLVGRWTVTYSVSIHDYAPMCRRCNRWSGGNLRGEDHGRAKLTETDVLSVRDRLARGERLDYAAEAANLGVSDATLRSAATRITWKHLD